MVQTGYLVNIWVLVLSQFLFIQQFLGQTYNTSDVIFTSIIYRHGARTPAKLYPTDPYKNSSSTYWPEGLGQLTNEGKLQHYNLGKWFKQKYPHLLLDRYSKDDVYIFSTDVDRTLMSAQCNLAGVFPAKDEQIWNPELMKWQPIPVHSNAVKFDNLLKGEKPCERYDYEYNRTLASDEIQGYLNKMSPLLKYLTKYTGLQVKTFSQLSDIHDALLVEKFYKLQWPTWATNKIFAQLSEGAKFSFRLYAYNTVLARFKVGVLFNEIITNMVDKSKGQLSQKVWFYSAHDTTLANVLMGLNLFDTHFPQYTASLFFNLRKRNDTYGVTIEYRNTTKLSDPVPLILPGCDYFCELNTFIQLLKPVTISPSEWETECKINTLDKTIYENAFIFAFLVILTIMIVSYVAVMRLKKCSNPHVQAYTPLNVYEN